MDSRPTLSITPTGSQDVIVYKAYATITEARDVTDQFALQVETLPEDKRKLNGTVYGVMQSYTLRAMLVSINGHKDGDDVNGKVFDCIEYLNALPSTQFSEVYEAIKEALDGKKKAAS